MDPNLFHLDYERLGDVLIAITVLAFFLERALAILFEHRSFATRFGGSGLKAPIAFIVALGICRRRSEEHTSELQSQSNLVCRLLLEKKKLSIACLHTW